jgi:menaquinone-dependent protoporphyrinogen oxidase
MARVCIVFESRYGQTRRIAERVAELAQAGGHEALVRRAALATAADLRWASAVVLLAPVYDRKHAQEVTDFARDNRELLAARPSAFFSVSLSAAFKSKWFAEHASGQLVREFLAATGLEPVAIAVVAGGFNYRAYSPGVRFGMRLAALAIRLPTDTGRAHELTDWTKVERVAGEFLRSLGVAGAPAIGAPAIGTPALGGPPEAARPSFLDR